MVELLCAGSLFVTSGHSSQFALSSRRAVAKLNAVIQREKLIADKALHAP
jgi:hypothetical protein